MQQYNGHLRQRMRLCKLRSHAGRHGDGLPWHGIALVAWSAPRHPSWVTRDILSANGERQRLGGSGSGLLNAAAQSFPSPTTRSVVFLKDTMASAACSDFGNFAAVALACGGNQ
jgi:hypothetical protein